jgi:hypothetical protein
MIEKRDIAGLWWFPVNPDERWVGTLTLSPKETPRLSLPCFRAGRSIDAIQSLSSFGGVLRAKMMTL